MALIWLAGLDSMSFAKFEVGGIGVRFRVGR